MADSVWIIGIAILALLLVQMVVAVYGSIRRLDHEQTRRRMELELFEQRVGAARALRAQREQEASAWTGYRKFEVQRKVDEGGDICSFYLAPHDRKRLPGFRPGQYLTFKLDIPQQDKPIVRCYSLSDGPGSSCYRVSIKRARPPRDKPDAPPGLSSNYFHDQVNEGDILDVKAPSGHFFLDLSRQDPIVLIGGGVGLTPVLSMLNAVVADASKRETWFFYGVRNSQEHILSDHFRSIAAQHDHIHMNVCYSDPSSNDSQGEHYDHAERISVDLFKQRLPSNNYDFYICGPPPMMQSLTTGLEQWGVPKDRVHFEAFGPATVKRTARKPDTSSAADSDAAQVTFSKSGKTMAWDPSYDSLLEFAEAQGIDIESGCRAGNCGTCLTAIKSGNVRYATEPGAEPEEGSCLTCVCIPQGPLVLDA